MIKFHDVLSLIEKLLQKPTPQIRESLDAYMYAHWRGGKGAIQTITRAKVIQTLFSNYSDRCFDGTTATSAS